MIMPAMRLPQNVAELIKGCFGVFESHRRRNIQSDDRITKHSAVATQARLPLLDDGLQRGCEGHELMVCGLLAGIYQGLGSPDECDDGCLSLVAQEIDYAAFARCASGVGERRQEAFHVLFDSVLVDLKRYLGSRATG